MDAKEQARAILDSLKVLEVAPLRQCFHCYRVVYDFEGKSRCWGCGGPYLQTLSPARPLFRSGTDLGIYDFRECV